MSTARKTYRQLVSANIFGVRDRIKEQRKNPKNVRYSRKRRRR